MGEEGAADVVVGVGVGEADADAVGVGEAVVVGLALGLALGVGLGVESHATMRKDIPPSKPIDNALKIFISHLPGTSSSISL
jgi:hypothetical protein